MSRGAIATLNRRSNNNSVANRFRDRVGANSRVERMPSRYGSNLKDS